MAVAVILELLFAAALAQSVVPILPPYFQRRGQKVRLLEKLGFAGRKLIL